MSERIMKDSGIEWIGDIPKDWKLLRLKNILAERNEKNDPIITDNILSLGLNYGVIPYSEREISGGNKAKDDLTQYKVVRPNDIVMNSMNVISGSVGKSNYFGCVSPVYYMFYPRTEVFDINYYNMIFQSKAFQRSLLGLGNGIMMKENEEGNFNTVRMRIPLIKLNNIILPIPSKEEQTKISNFLDAKISQIDNVISKTKESIEEYKKLKQSIITEAVTKGLDPNVEMKDSGIEWIGYIPKEWQITRVKNTFSSSKGLPITKENLIESGLSVVSYGQIHAKSNMGVDVTGDLIRYVDNEYENTYPQCEVKKGDFIFADTSEDYDGCGNCVYKRDDSKLYAGYHCIILKTKENTDNRYFAYQFQTDFWRKQLREVATGVKLFSIGQKTLMASIMLLPSKKEQVEIADYLDNKLESYNKLIDNSNKVIEELEQYKKSLIYEYVTGKKEVA